MFNRIKLRAIPELDTIRFISILLVLSHHLFLDQNAILDWAKHHAWVGVDIFFVLSGYIITTLLKKELEQTNEINLKRFWIKRIFRLWPGWLLTIIISFPLAWYYSRNDFYQREFLINNIWHYLFHFGNYSHAIYGKLHTIYSHFWSLAIEEHFYLIWPILLLFITKKRLNLTRALLLLMLIPLCFRLIHGYHEATYAFIKLSTHTRFDELLAGCLLAFHIDKISKLNFKIELFLTLLMLIFFYVGLHLLDDTQTRYYLSSFNFLFISIASVLLIIIALKGTQNGLRKLLQIKLFSKIGILSYNIYLLHFLVINIFFGINSKFMFIKDHNLIFMVVSVVSIILSYFMYIVIDEKVNKLRHHL